MLLWLQGVGGTCHAKSPLPITASLCRFEQGDDLASDSSNPLANTMLQIYDATNVGYVVWNDQVPGSKGIPPRTPHAHSKGEDPWLLRALGSPHACAHKVHIDSLMCGGRMRYAAECWWPTNWPTSEG